MQKNPNYAAKTLLELGANPSIGGGIFGSALHLACSNLNYSIVNSIVKKTKIQPNLGDIERNTCLHIIFMIFSKNVSSSFRICEILLKAGAEPNIKNKDRYTPLHLAVKKNQKEAVTFAILYNKTIDGNFHV